MSQTRASELPLVLPFVPAFATAVHARELSRVPDLVALVSALRRCAFPWLLDSAMRVERLGRFSFAGADPYLVVRARGRDVELECRRRVRPDLAPGPTRFAGDPLDVARSLLAPLVPAPGSDSPPVPFAGGAVGYLGYELASCAPPVRSGRAVPSRPLSCPRVGPRDDLGLPDLVLLFVDRLVAVDHESGRAWAIGLGFGRDAREADANARRASDELVPAALEAPAGSAGRAAASSCLPALAPAGLEASLGRTAYAEAVREILREIAAGNVYQANLTQRMDLRLPDADPLALYRALRELNPAPFAAYLELPEASILSSSPERFVAVDARGAVESRPIKGTRPRGATADEDRRLRRELECSPKDRAENLMIVDLVRNDLGRVCELRSVEVTKLMQVEDYATVFQLVSEIRGRLRRELGALDLVRASFPPGSMTGAPKLAAMQIIERLEPVRRGVYSGALGYFDLRGGCDLSVVIRTLIVAGGRAHLHVGGGVVADSEPDAEYRESLDKARALLAALARVAHPAPPVRASAPAPTSV